MNRQSAVFRIIIYSAIILLLLSILIVGLAFRSFTVRIDNDRSVYITSQTTFPASDIQKLEIEWASGDIHIVTAETDSISVAETGANEDTKAVIYRSGNTLSIRYHEANLQFGITSIPHKDLTVTVPVGWHCNELSIDAASVNLETGELTIDEAELNLASADCRFEHCNLGNLDIDAASGQIFVSGTVQTLDCDAASANVTAILENVPQSIDFDTASGDLDLTLPENASFTVEMDTMSGNFSSDFNTTHQGARHTCGDGACRITVDGMSGDVIIRKMK